MFRPSSPTRIYVNGRFLAQATTGVQRYARETLDAIDQILTSECTTSWTVLAPRGISAKPRWKHIALREVGRLSGHAWEQLDLPRYASGGWLLTLSGAPSILHRAHVFAIHDAALYDMPEGYSRQYRMFYRLIYWLSVNRCKGLLTVSNYSRNRLAHWFPCVAGRIVNTYCGADHLQRQSVSTTTAASVRITPPHPYALAVSSLAPNKNFQAIVALSALLSETDPKIAVVGGTHSGVFSRGALDHSRLFRLGYVSDGALEDLYKNATCFLFPSLYEGFGLPPIEAMSFGCPVIASNATSIPEVCGDAALYFDPRSVVEFQSQLLRLLSEPDLAEQLRKQGLVQAERYTWNRVAQTVLHALETLVLTGAFSDSSR